MLYTAGFLTSLITVLLLLGWFLGNIIGFYVAFLLSIIILLTSYVFAEKMLIKIYGAKRLENEELDKILNKLSFEGEVKKPSLYVIDSRIPNSFVVGRGSSHSTIVITKGIFDLSVDEIEGVLSHQVGHLHRNDMTLLGSVAIVSYIISYIGQKAYWAFYESNPKRNAKKILGIIFMVIFGSIAAVITRTFLTTRIEYRADNKGAVITKNPMALATALRKIEAIAKHEKIKGPAATAHLWIVNPFEGDTFTKFFYTNLPLKNRIRMLETAANRGGREREMLKESESLF